MSALDGFYSTWNKARKTFGQGTPDDGSQFDGSSRLMQMKAGVEAAAPDDRWQGSGSQAYAAVNKEHAAVYEKLAELDRKMAGEVKKAADVVKNGRTNLDTAKGWVESMVNSLPSDLSAADRENKLIPIAREGITKVNNIVTSATDDMTTIKGDVDKLKGDYDAVRESVGSRSDGTKSGEDVQLAFGDTDPKKSESAEKYADGQRAADKELFDSPGPWTQEKQDAAGRLRDYDTLNNPNADETAIKCASRRLDDYFMAQYVGPLPIDPVLGNDARARARARLELQRQLEAGLHGMPPQSPDVATQMLDTSEAMARDIVLKTLEQQLGTAGVSDAGVSQVISNLATAADAAGTGAGQYGKSAAGDMFAGLSRSDLDQLAKAGGRVSMAANAVQAVMAFDKWMDGGSNEEFGRSAGSLLGSVLGGMATGAAVGSVGGPFTAAGAAIIGGFVGGIWGGDFGAEVGRQFDPPPATPSR
ncbi:EspA/EspE family type VII secretion system effector [Mycobacterium sp. LTG2003]